jgi:hypothetical protein
VNRVAKGDKKTIDRVTQISDFSSYRAPAFRAVKKTAPRGGFVVLLLYKLQVIIPDAEFRVALERDAGRRPLATSTQ